MMRVKVEKSKIVKNGGKKVEAVVKVNKPVLKTKKKVVEKVKDLPPSTIDKIFTKLKKDKIVDKPVLRKKVEEKVKDLAPATIDKIFEKLKGGASKMMDKYAGNITYGKELAEHLDKYSRKLANEMKKKPL